jgi:hypothetical protein
MVLHSLHTPWQLTSGKPDAQGSSVLADHPMREWIVEPIVYEVMLTKNAYENCLLKIAY